MNVTFQLLIVLVPGVISSLIFYPKIENFKNTSLSIFFSIAIYAFIILLLNTAVLAQLGLGSEIHFLMRVDYSNDFLLKYLSSSLLFSVTLPFVIEWLWIMIRKIESKLNVKF